VSEEAPDDESLVVRVGDGPALVLVRLEVAHSRKSLIVQAALRPDLAQTIVGTESARALGLSPGQGVMLQLARRPDGDGDLWGPCELVTLAVDDRDGMVADDEDATALLLGRDFLHAVWVSFVGDRMVMITRLSPE
jgi:hypothetical protein